MKRINNKGDVWISALLYFGLGIVLLTIILAAGTPIIQKMRDKNVVLQTKEVMFTLDKAIREVAKGGPGTQRVLQLNIEKGSFTITATKIAWSYESKAILSEPGTPIKEGNLNMMTDTSGTVTLTLEYLDKIELIKEATIDTAMQGKTSLTIKNGGSKSEQSANDDLIDIILSVS